MAFLRRFEEDQTFDSAVQSVSETFDLPDGDWVIKFDAPFGAVTGSVVMATGNTTTAPVMSWGLCQAREQRQAPFLSSHECRL